MDLAVQQLRDGDAVVVVVAGEVDLATLPRLRTALAAALAAPVRSVVVDLDAVGALEPVALGAFLELKVRADALGAELTLRAGGARVRRVLEHTGLDRLIPVDDECR